MALLLVLAAGVAPLSVAAGVRTRSASGTDHARAADDAPRIVALFLEGAGRAGVGAARPSGGAGGYRGRLLQE
ncbi:hypothetical protein J1G43_05360 [Cellulomonas sp. zg-ZUI22]|uniref:hypothetical protein n=1 Tax=Cellulomonas sp. zg-ZUI22 TaxID=2816955 RepID=UPI001A944AB4|nr:hypothetical protein [Cellulomonas sp. zg-ZUI22]MBO0899390.1 hypothetical protein [Cellulomonas sp. zg-ZUI22]